MPSPVGHGLAAVAAGWGVAGVPAPRRARWVQAGLFLAIGLAPDLDLLAGRHNAETHSIGAALLVAGLAAWWRWPVAGGRGRIFLAVLAAWLSHPLVDALGSDDSPPVGVMAFWPFSSAYLLGDLGVFMAISRRWWLVGFLRHNLTAVAREAALLGPAAALAWWTGRRRRPG